jgi:hypothetical protein
MVAEPPRLPLPNHVYSLVARNRSPCCSELAKALLGLHSSFNRSMILLQDIVQILDRSMAAAPAQGSFRFHCDNRRAVEAGLISVDDPVTAVRGVCLLKEPCRAYSQRTDSFDAGMPAGSKKEHHAACNVRVDLRA